jgi:Methyltransferase domain
VTFSSSSRNRLTHHDLGRFGSGTLLDRLGRAVCAAGCVPRKELYEAWEVARRVRRVHRGGRVVDAGGGHGLLAHVMLLLDNSSPDAVVVDRKTPASAATVQATLVHAWPRLDRRVAFMESDVATFPLQPTDVVVSCHACGALTDHILDRAMAVNAPVAVLPCCHDFETCRTGSLGGWMDTSLAIDTMRAVRLERHGYRILTQTIPATITPKNRLLIGIPGKRESRFTIEKS